MCNIQSTIYAAAVAAALLATPARAGGPAAVGIAVIAPLTAKSLAIAGVGGLLLHEGVQALNGKQAFGPNGEGMKAARGICRLAFRSC